MTLDDLYSISRNLVRATNDRWFRYLYYLIDWDLSMLCIKGSRGIGKTTMMLQRIRHCFGDSRVAVYVSLDNLWFTENRLFDFVHHHYNHGGTHIFIDEVHRYPHKNWMQEMKNIYDSFPGYHVVFTGSSLLKIDMAQADLSRRCIFYDMQGLSFREYLEMNELGNFPVFGLNDVLHEHQCLENIVLEQVKPLQHFNDYLKRGYYPYYKKFVTTYREALQQMVNAILESDISPVVQVEWATLLKFRKLLQIVASTAPFTPNLSNLAHDLGTNRNKIYEMLSIMERAALITNLYSGKETMQQMRKPQKLYLENTNLLYALSSSVSIGSARETFFCNQVRQQHKLAYTKQGDFLIDGVSTIEVGGKNKSFDLVKSVNNSYLAIDDVEMAIGNRIPLWLFGFLY